MAGRSLAQVHNAPSRADLAKVPLLNIANLKMDAHVVVHEHLCRVPTRERERG